MFDVSTTVMLRNTGGFRDAVGGIGSQRAFQSDKLEEAKGFGIRWKRFFICMWWVHGYWARGRTLNTRAIEDQVPINP